MSALAPDAPSPAFDERLVKIFAGAGLLLLLLVCPFTEDPIEQRTFAVASDGQGNVRALHDMADGQRAALYEYGPFVESLRVSGPFAEANPIRWSSKFTDPETGWSYYGHRYFLPAQGRWASRDPLGETGGLNLYTGIANNPAQWVDPTGRQVLIEPVAPTTEAGTPSGADFAWVDARPLSLYAAPASTETAGLRDTWFDNLASTRPFDEYNYQKYQDILLNGESARWKYDIAENLWEVGQSVPDLCLALATEGIGLYASLAAKSIRLSSLAAKSRSLLDDAPRAIVPEIRALSEANITGSGRTVLGHYPGYIEKAQRTGASYFDIGDAWNTLTPAQRTAANNHFLDVVTGAGDQIYLSVPKGSINPGSALADEVRYLTGEKGYQWINQWSLKPGGN
jgi:RHS repeat-associated protein